MLSGAVPSRWLQAEDRRMIRDIMVHLDGSCEDEIKLEHAEAIARTWRAHLIGLYTNLLPDLTMALPMDGGGAAVAGLIAELEEKAREEGGPVFDKLAARLDTLQVSHELRRLDERPGTLFQSVVREAHCADLFLATRPFQGEGSSVCEEIVEAVLFGSGRGLLVIPPGRHWQASKSTLLIAWNGSREAARAVAEAMSFVKNADRTVILTIDVEADTEPAAEIARHLNRHGGRVEVTARNSEGRKVADVIIDEAYRVSAGLVVLGGYGHMRLRERVFGGATYDMLYTCETPILLAH